MPTPAKLVCAVLFAALGWWTADTMVREVLERGALVGRFREIVALGGLIIGWRVVGRVCSGPLGKGTTIMNAIASGVAGAFILVVAGVVVHGLYDMLQTSLGGRFTELGAAAEAWTQNVVRDARLVADPVVLGTLFGGGAVVGLIGGITGRTLR